MSGDSPGASSHRPTIRSYVPRKKKNTNLMPYIIGGGSLLVIAVIGIAVIAMQETDKPTSTASTSRTNTVSIPAKTSKTASKSSSSQTPSDDLEAARSHIAEVERQISEQNKKNAVMARLTSSYDARIAALSKKQDEEFTPLKKELESLYAAAATASPPEKARLRPRIQQLEERFQKVSAELDSDQAQLEKDMNEAQAQGVFPNQGHPQQPPAQEPPASADTGNAERERLLAGIQRRKAEIEKDFLDECSSEWERVTRGLNAARANPGFGDLFSSSGRQNYNDIAALTRQGNELQKGASGKSAPAERRRQRLAPLEQERRQILTRYPAPGDQKFTEQQGMLVTEAEIAEQNALLQKQEAEKKKLEDEHGSLRVACQAVIKSLEQKGVVSKPTYVGTFTDPESKEWLLVVTSRNRSVQKTQDRVFVIWRAWEAMV